MIHKMLAFLILCVLCSAAAVCGAGGAGDKPVAQASNLILCGWDEVYVLETTGRGDSLPRKVWSWKAKDRPELPDSIRLLFDTTDDCKPVDGGRNLLITSSGGAAALVERSTGRVLFYGRADNAHSAERLPGGRIAVAASHVPGGQGDRLIVFEQCLPGREIASAELPWGHGVVWDAKRQILYALSNTDIRLFKLEGWSGPKPALKRLAVIDLPESGGHDLLPVPGTAWLSVSTGGHCWLFDRDKRSLAPHPDLADKKDIKSISVDPRTGRLAWTQAVGADWWTERVDFLHPSGSLVLPGEHLYKIRWDYTPAE
jgi:hypothetical protein